MIDAIATLDRYRYTLQGVYRRGHDPERYCQELWVWPIAHKHNLFPEVWVEKNKPLACD